MRSQKALDQEGMPIYSKGFVVDSTDSTFIDFISTKPIGMDEEKVKIFLAQIGKKLEELNKQHHTQQ